MMIYKEFRPARKYASLTTGEVVKMLRELKGWSQAELARKSKIHTTNISMIENDKIDIGKLRAIAFAKAFGIHPAIIMFPEYEAEYFEKAA